jgi:hypothetical protein
VSGIANDVDLVVSLLGPATHSGSAGRHPNITHIAPEEQQVAIRVTPCATFATLPR